MFKRFIFFFSLLIIFISVYFAYTSISFTTKILDWVATREAVRFIKLSLEKDNILDGRVLARLRDILGGEIFIYNREGQLLTSTYPDEVPEKLQVIPEQYLTVLEEGPVVKKIHLGEKVFRLVLFKARLSPTISSYFGLLLPTTFEQRIKWELTVGLVYTALSGLVFMIIVSWFLSRSITTPLERLVKVANRLGSGDLMAKAPQKGPPEVRELARALNEMSRKLNEYQQRLIETERLATAAQLAASVAHEIKNPLTSLRLAAELLCTLLKDQPDLAKRAEVILREATRLENTVQNMLKRTRKLDLSLKEVDINKLAQEVVESASYQLKARKQNVSLQLAKKPLRAYIDPEKMKQVLWNLINNASDVTPQNGMIKVITEEVDKEYVAIIIEDSGTGIPEEQMKKIFKPFYTTKPGGTGLGLAISRQIVLLHRGELILENKEEGRGARAKVIIPRFLPPKRSASKT